MKKMSFVTKALVLLLMGAMLAGCSDNKAVEKESEKTEESASKSEESKKTQESTSEESKSSAETETGTEETSSTENFGSGADINGGGLFNGTLEEKYEEYFKTFDFDGKKISLVYTGDLGMGTESTLKMEFGSKDGSSMIYIGAPAASGGMNECSIYFLADKSAYLGIAVQGETPEYYKTSQLDEETFNSMNLAGSLVDLEETENGDVDLVYVGEKTLDGVLYDELYINDETSDSDTRVYVYMDKKTGELGKMKGLIEGEEMYIDIIPMDAVKLPAGFDNAQEQEAEDFTYTMAFAMLGVMMGGE